MRIGVCSWSLQPNSPEELCAAVQSCGLNSVQLALEPILQGQWSLSETKRIFADHGIAVLSTMIQTQGEDYSTLESIKLTGGLRPDAHWNANLETAKRAAPLVSEFGATLVTFHAGFLPHESNDPVRALMIERLRAVCEVFAEAGIDVALETGQESSETLRGLLEELSVPHLGVNFDPANMILYNMGEPVQALLGLAPWVKQIHLKDAVLTKTHGEWGTEVPIGTGEVDWQAFFEAARKSGLDVDLCIEREAGEQRVSDITSGLIHLASLGIRP